MLKQYFSRSKIVYSTAYMKFIFTISFLWWYSFAMALPKDSIAILEMTSWQWKLNCSL